MGKSYCQSSLRGEASQQYNLMQTICRQQKCSPDFVIH